MKPEMLSKRSHALNTDTLSQDLNKMKADKNADSGEDGMKINQHEIESEVEAISNEIKTSKARKLTLKPI